jgi:hypothetical protein
VGPLLQATRTVPIVFPIITDPVGAGLVDIGAAGRQCHWFHEFRIQHGREMAGAAQADRARRDASGGPSGCHSRRRNWQFCRHPGRGAVAQGGGKPGQHGRRGRDRARRCSLRSLSEWRSDRASGHEVAPLSRSDHHAGKGGGVRRGEAEGCPHHRCLPTRCPRRQSNCAPACVPGPVRRPCWRSTIPNPVKWIWACPSLLVASRIRPFSSWVKERVILV